MPNILDRYPGARIDVHRSGEFIDPSDYAAQGISVETPSDGTIVLTAPNIGGSGFIYEVSVVPVTPIVAEAVRLTVLEFPGEPPDPGYPRAGTDIAVTEIGPIPFLITTAGDWAWVSVSAGRQGV